MLESERMAYHENYPEGWNSYDPETVVAQFAEGGTYVDPNVEEPLEGVEIGEYVVGIMNGFPDFRFKQRWLLMTSKLPRPEGRGIQHGLPLNPNQSVRM